MSHFYGIIQGNRGEASRGGSKKSGYRTVAASWQGCVRVSLWHDEKTGLDMVSVYKDQWQNGAGIRKNLYTGPVGKED